MRTSSKETFLQTVQTSILGSAEGCRVRDLFAGGGGGVLRFSYPFLCSFGFGSSGHGVKNTGKRLRFRHDRRQPELAMSLDHLISSYGSGSATLI